MNDQQKIYYRYLDNLRLSGQTNMFGAGAYLEREFNLSKSDARKILTSWMKQFNGRQEN